MHDEAVSSVVYRGRSVSAKKPNMAPRNHPVGEL